jgi:hypothetical protein
VPSTSSLWRLFFIFIPPPRAPPDKKIFFVVWGYAS